MYSESPTQPDNVQDHVKEDLYKGHIWDGNQGGQGESHKGCTLKSTKPNFSSMCLGICQ